MFIIDIFTAILQMLAILILRSKCSVLILTSHLKGSEYNLNLYLVKSVEFSIDFIFDSPTGFYLKITLYNNQY